MKKFLLTASAVAVMVMTGCKTETNSVENNTVTAKNETTKSEATVGALTTEKEKFTYSIGYNLGSQIANMKDELDRDVLIASLIEGLDGKDLNIETEEIMAIQKAVFTRMNQAEKDKNLKRVEDGKKFLEANKTQEGVITTESGLQYKVVSAGGEGDKPLKTDKVTVHYTGKRVDGEIFDSSHKRGKPATFPLGGVIPGWTEVLQLMTVGMKVEAYIPSELAYGARGAGQKIGPNEMLIFEIELIGIEKAPAPKAAEAPAAPTK